MLSVSKSAGGIEPRRGVARGRFQTMPKPKKAKRATFNRDMYPGVKFCEVCFTHHNWPTCPFPPAEFRPTNVQLEDNPYLEANGDN